MRFLARQSRRSLLAIGAAGAAVLLVTLWGAWMLQPRLVIEVPPMAERIDWGGAILVVQPRVAIRDGFGRPLPWVKGTVRARTVNNPLAGDSGATLLEGRAQFSTLALGRMRDTSWFRDELASIDFRGPWYARSVRSAVPGAWLGAMPDAFRLISVTVNGETLGADHIARVRRGSAMQLDIVFEYSTARPTANYVVGASATWIPRDSIVRLTGLPSPVRDAWQSVSFRLPPPTNPGVAYVVVLAGAEDLVENIFSATSWTVGRPIWGNGNDVADLSVESLERLRREGIVELEYDTQDYLGAQSDLRVGDSVFARTTRPRHVARRPFTGTAIRIVVAE